MNGSPNMDGEDPELDQRTLYQSVRRIADWFAVAENRADFAAAGLVWGVDIDDPENRALFYGKVTLDRIDAGAVVDDRRLAPVEVPIDFGEASGDLEFLFAACRQWKGSCCYKGRGEEDDPDDINPEFN